MKCEFCGANIDIESDVCPHCGMQKAQFAKHREEMNVFKTNFDALRTGVVEENKAFSKKASFITAIVILLMLNLALILCHAMNYSIYRFFLEKSLKNHVTEHAQALSELEDAKDYEAFHYYYDVNHLSYIRQLEVLEEYSLMENMCTQYNNFITYFPLVALKDYSQYESIDSNYEQYAELTISAYDRIIEMNEKYVLSDERTSLYSDSAFSEKHMKSYENIIFNMDSFIQTYCRFTDEEMEAFRSDTKAGRIVRLEKAYEKEVDTDE